MNSKSFFIVEDHALMRQGIASMLEQNRQWVCLGKAGSLTEARTLFAGLTKSNTLPSVVIEDLNLGDEDGLTFIKELHASHPEIKTLVYSMYTSSGVVQRCLTAGATGYISKSASEQEFIKAIETVNAGRLYIEQNMLEPLVTYRNSISSLTKRETQVLELTLQGKSNAEIAIALNLEKRAVENYISRIYTKTGCKNHTDLINQL
jgi:DNA-binding NarL/FixJ family response regulator